VNFLFPKDVASFRVSSTSPLSDEEGIFEFKKNSKGETSLVQFECTATGPMEARRKFQRAVLPVLDRFSYLANCPVVVTTLTVTDPKNDHVTIEYVSPYQKVTINPHDGTIFFQMSPVYAMYREAKNSNSDFYKFLCYHKILEGLLGPLRTRVFQYARDRGTTLEGTKETVPDSEHIRGLYRTYIGKSIKVFFDEVMTPHFRKAVAHFVTDKGGILNMSAPEHIDSYAEILYMYELCVRTAIQSHESLLKDLQSKDNT
jgi:hypothetical protein